MAGRTCIVMVLATYACAEEFVRPTNRCFDEGRL
jgi:hypothetical protein